MLTSLGTISSPTVNSPCWILSLSLCFNVSFVSGVGTEISPPSPFSFFLRGCRSASEGRLNLCRLKPWDVCHSCAIWPPFLAIYPFLFFISYFLASSDQLTLVSSLYPSTSSFNPFLFHVIVSKLPAWRFLFAGAVASGSELVSFLFIAAGLVSNEESRCSHCLAAYDCRSPRHLKDEIRFTHFKL